MNEIGNAWAQGGHSILRKQGTLEAEKSLVVQCHDEEKGHDNQSHDDEVGRVHDGEAETSHAAGVTILYGDAEKVLCDAEGKVLYDEEETGLDDEVEI